MASVRLGPSAAVPEGESLVARVRGFLLLIARVGGRVHVVENVCGHQSRTMDGGALCTGPGGEPCIECPHHAIWFDLRDGHVVKDAGHVDIPPIATFAVREEGGTIWIDLPDPPSGAERA